MPSLVHVPDPLPPPAASVTRIVSGGQTGVDRAALDVARRLGIPYGGWCPRGGLAEDHPEPPGLLSDYPNLRETPSADSAERTAWNVRDSDATLVITPEVSSPGTALTVRTAHDLGRRVLVSIDAGEVAGWLRGLGADLTLNVAGPRASQWPGAYGTAYGLLERVLSRVAS